MTGLFRRLQREESGSTLILTIFFSALCLVLVLLVTAATSLYIERKRLFSLADSAALAGAEAFGLSDVTTTGRGAGVSLDSARVSALVADHVASVPHSFSDLRIDRAASPDGSSVVVQLSSTWRPPVVSLLVPDGLLIDVEASARSVFS